MTHEVRRIEPRSAIRIGFVLGLAGGFLLGLFEMLLFRAMSGSGNASLLPPEAKQFAESGGGTWLLVAIITGLVMSLMAALAGGLAAVLYNAAARLFGGIEFTMNAPPPSAVVPGREPDEEAGDV